MANKEQVEQMRLNNEVPFKVVNWLEELEVIEENEEFGKIYNGVILAEDAYGVYTALVGTTDELLAAPIDQVCNGSPYKIMGIAVEEKEQVNLN